MTVVSSSVLVTVRCTKLSAVIIPQSGVVACCWLCHAHEWIAHETHVVRTSPKAGAKSEQRVRDPPGRHSWRSMRLDTDLLSVMLAKGALITKGDNHKF